MFEIYSSKYKSVSYRRWFLVTGVIGLLVIPITFFLAITYNLVPESLMFILWPSAFLLLVEPYTVGGKIVKILLMFGGIFLIYGMIGCCLGYLVSRLRPLFVLSKIK